MTESETAEIKQEIVSLEIRYRRAQRECLHLFGQMFRLRQKLKPLTPEERAKSLEQCKGIGSGINKKKG